MINKFLARFKSKHLDDYYFFLSQLDKMYKYAPSDFGGGCSYEKALVIAFLIKEFKFDYSVDIGVYRGRSLFPQSLAHKHYTGGRVYAIDPYDKISATQFDRPDLKDILVEFVKETNFDEIYESVVKLIDIFELKENTLFIRQKSHEASEYFINNNIQLNLIHIDGNHDTKFVMQDVSDYVPLLKEGGIIVLDDISWNSVKPAYNYLTEKLKHVGNCININNDFAVFIKESDINNEKASIANSILDTAIKFVQRNNSVF